MERDFGVGKYFVLWAFGIAFGYLEAAVVIYLRAIYGLDSGSLFPVAEASVEPGSLLMAVEPWREAATIVMLATPAYFASRRNVYRILSFVLIFGVWDLSYYGFLKLHLGWPSSLLSYDILFLIPTLWVAPVICPILLAFSMAAYATWLMPLAHRRGMKVPPLTGWLLLLLGVGLILYSFTSNAAYYLQGGLPPLFPWAAFGAGYGFALTAGLLYLFQTARRKKNKFF